MSFAKKFLSRFFGSAGEGAEMHEETQPESTPAALAEEPSAAEIAEEPALPEPDPTHIVLPDDHALHQLWQRQADQTEHLPLCSLN